MIDCLMTSGAEILATQIASGLDPERFESILCSTRPSAPEHVAAARDAGVTVLELPRRSKFDLWQWRPLVRLLRSGSVDVLHAHKIGSNLWASIFSYLAHVPVLIAHEHTWSFEGKPLRRLVDRDLIARRADVVLAVSESDRDKMIGLEGMPAEKVRFVPNGIPDRPLGDGAALRAELGLHASVPVVGTVCGLRSQKAVEDTIEAVARLAPEHPDLCLLVVGDGPERNRLEREAAPLGARVRFLGRRPNAEMPDILAAMDVLVSSSTFEGTPLSILEWMAAGKAIVATAVGGVPAILEDGVHALLLPPRDPAALASVVGRLLADPDERRRLGEAARRRQQEEFRLTRTIRILERLYEDLYTAAVR
jgi:glycosyltransferase involved in cell wall biosynthesis